MTFPTSVTIGQDVDPNFPANEEPYGIWMTTESHEDLVARANAKKTRITWPECVFAIFAMFFICVALGIIFR